MESTFKAVRRKSGENGGILRKFGQFMEQMKGKNPNALSKSAVGGKVMKDQLNQVSRQGQQQCRGFLSRFFRYEVK